MNELVTINDRNLSLKEYQGQRVVTFKEIDFVHGRPEGTASRNFKVNRKRFIEGVDYFTVKPTDFQKDEIRPLEIPNRGITLITKMGYLMLVKSFTDALSWQIQRHLVTDYFEKEVSSSLDAGKHIQTLEQRITALEQQLTSSSTFQLNYIISLLEGQQKPLAGQNQSSSQSSKRQTPLGIPTQTSIKSPVRESVKQPDDDLSPTPEKRLLNIDEFMEYTGLGKTKSNQLAKESGAVMRIGSRFLIDKQKFNKWCDTNSSIK